jgi:hypothetical protein
MGGQEPNRTATMSTAPSVAELQRENIVLELECIDRIYLNAFVPKLTSEKGIAGYFREFMGHRFASTKSAGKSRSCRAPERRRRNAQSGIQRPSSFTAMFCAASLAKEGFRVRRGVMPSLSHESPPR